MWASDVHAERAGYSRRRRLLIGVVQRGHSSLRQPGLSTYTDAPCMFSLFIRSDQMYISCRRRLKRQAQSCSLLTSRWDSATQWFCESIFCHKHHHTLSNTASLTLQLTGHLQLPEVVCLRIAFLLMSDTVALSEISYTPYKNLTRSWRFSSSPRAQNAKL